MTKICSGFQETGHRRNKKDYDSQVQCLITAFFLASLWADGVEAVVVCRRVYHGCHGSVKKAL